MDVLQAGAVALASYALGCLCTGYYLVRLRTGVDVRSQGSGAVGASNTGRLLGPAGFILTLLGDAARGAVAVWIGLRFGPAHWGGVLALLAVVTGHVLPAQLGFRGGKGIAPAAGGLLVLDPVLALGVFALQGVMLLLVRRFTASGLLTVLLSPAAALLLRRPVESLLVVTVLVPFLLFAHRANLREILAQIGKGPPRRGPAGDYR